MDKSKKAIATTLGLTVVLFGFIIFLLYVIYCYAYYDKYLEQVYTDNINNKEYKLVYEKMVGKGNLTYEQFITSINNLTNKDRLIEIFNTYYKDSGLYNQEDFLNNYYFKNINVKTEDIKFTHNGKTNLVTRRAIFYDYIKVSNGNSNVALGVFNKVVFKIEDNSILRIDDKEITCNLDTCIIDKIYGGIYEISYISNGYEYYGLVNIDSDKQIINVTNLESLVKVKELKVEVKYGKYNMKTCNKCSLDKSYLMLNQDGTYYSYRYYEDKGNASIEAGTYSINGNNIVLRFKDKEETYNISGINIIESNNLYSYIYSE